MRLAGAMISQETNHNSHEVRMGLGGGARLLQDYLGQEHRVSSKFHKSPVQNFALLQCWLQRGVTSVSANREAE